MPERDDGGGTEPDGLGRARQIREGDERLQERPIGALHPVRVEDEVVSNPQGIEAEALGESGSIDQEVLIGVLAEVRDEQAEAGHETSLGSIRR